MVMPAGLRMGAGGVILFALLALSSALNWNTQSSTLHGYPRTRHDEPTGYARTRRGWSMMRLGRGLQMLRLGKRRTTAFSSSSPPFSPSQAPSSPARMRRVLDALLEQRRKLMYQLRFATIRLNPKLHGNDVDEVYGSPEESVNPGFRIPDQFNNPEFRPENNRFKRSSKITRRTAAFRFGQTGSFFPTPYFRGTHFFHPVFKPPPGDLGHVGMGALRHDDVKEREVVKNETVKAEGSLPEEDEPEKV